MCCLSMGGVLFGFASFVGFVNFVSFVGFLSCPYYALFFVLLSVWLLALTLARFTENFSISTEYGRVTRIVLHFLADVCFWGFQQPIVKDRASCSVMLTSQFSPT